jgi:hypothetical protein
LSGRHLVSTLARAVEVWRVAVLMARVKVRLALEATKSGSLLVLLFGGSVGFRFGAGCCGTLAAMATKGGGCSLGSCRGGKMGCIGARTMLMDVAVAWLGGRFGFGGRSRRWRGGGC